MKNKLFSLSKKILKNDLVKGSIWYTFANIFIKGINFLTIPLFTRMLSTEQYGFVNNFLAWVTIFTVLVGLNLNNAINNAAFDFKKDIDNFVGTILAFSIGVFIFFEIVLNVGMSIMNTEHQLLYWNFVMLQSFALYVISIVSTYYTIKAQYYRNSLLSLLSVFGNIGMSVILMFSVYGAHPEWGRIIGSTCGLMILAIFLSVTIFLKMTTFPHKRYILYSLKISLPVIPHSLGGLILAQFDRIMISWYWGDGSAGIYSYVYNLGTVINILWLSINAAWVPWFYRRMEDKKYSDIKNAMISLGYVFTAISCMCLVFLTDLGKIIAPKTYLSGLALIVPIGASYFFMFMYSYAVNFEFYLKKTVYIGATTVLSAILNIVLNIILIPRFGYMIAGYTTLITYICLYISHHIVANRLERTMRINIFPAKSFILMIVIFLTYCIVILSVYNLISIRYLVLFIVLIVICCLLLKNLNNKAR